MSRRVSEIKDCLKTFEGDGIPVTRAFPIPGLREVDPFLLFDHFWPNKLYTRRCDGRPRASPLWF